jgi:hypothetical protein
MIGPPMPSITDQISAIEARLYGARVSVLALLREANVNKAQWSRWKFHGQRPLVETWERVLEAADRLAPKGRRRG